MDILRKQLPLKAVANLGLGFVQEGRIDSLTTLTDSLLAYCLPGSIAAYLYLHLMRLIFHTLAQDATCQRAGVTFNLVILLLCYS